MEDDARRGAAGPGGLDEQTARAVVAAPESSADALRDALHACPALAARVAAHPRADDALLRELEALDDRAVDAALRWREPPEGGWSRPLRGTEPAPPTVLDGAGARSAALGPAPVDGGRGARRPAGAAPRSSSATSRGRGRRARWWVAGAALIVALVAVVAIVLVRGATSRDHEDVVARLPAVALGSQRPSARWTLSTSDIAAALGGAASGIEVESLAGDAHRGVVVVSALVAGSRQERVLGVDLADGRVTWVQPGPPNGSCTGQGESLRCSDATAATSCEVPPTGTATAALCTSRLDGEARATPYDLAQGTPGAPAAPLVGLYDGDPITMALSSDVTSGEISFAVRRQGAVRWSTPLPRGVEVPRQVIEDGSTLTRFVTVLDVPASLGLVAVHVAAGVACTHFSGDGGRCPPGTTEDRGSTVLLDAASGAVRGTLDGEAELPVGDDWYVATARGLRLQRVDGTVLTDPRGLQDGTVVAVGDRVVVVSRVSRAAGHTLTAVSRDDGTDVWTQSGDALAVDGDLLVVRPSGDEGTVHALDLGSGAQAWSSIGDRGTRVWGSFLADVTDEGVTLLASAAS